MVRRLAFVATTILLATEASNLPACAQVNTNDAGSRAGPSNVGPMTRPSPMAKEASPGPEPTQRQCENLLRRAETVPALRQGADYDNCKRRFPIIDPTASVPATEKAGPMPPSSQAPAMGERKQ